MDWRKSHILRGVLLTLCPSKYITTGRVGLGSSGSRSSGLRSNSPGKIDWGKTGAGRSRIRRATTRDSEARRVSPGASVGSGRADAGKLYIVRECVRVSL